MSVFVWPTRVYWEDTDGGGVVYYANYLRFLERARTEWLRAHGFSQSELALDPGILFSVVEVNIKYRRPARLDDLLLISCVPALDGAASMIFSQRMQRGSEAGELEKAQVVGVVDHAAPIGIFPVHARWPDEIAQVPSPNSGRLAAARSGILSPKCCQALRVAMRPRAVRARNPCWIR